MSRLFRISALCAAAMLMAGVAAARPIITGVAVHDNRILDLSGSTNLTAGPVSAQLTVVESADGTIAVGAYVTGHGVAKTFITSGKLKAGRDGLSWSVSGRSSDGFSLKLKGTFQDVSGGQFALQGSLTGPFVDTEFTGTLVPQNTARGFGIGPVSDTDHTTRQMISPFFNTTGEASLKGKTGPASISVKEAFAKATFSGSIVKDDTVFNWVSGPKDSKLKIGKLNLTIPPSELFVTIVSSHS